MTHNDLLTQLILRCRRSPLFFIENFCKVKHPKAGIIPFKLFSYQKQSLECFKKYRFNCYKKTRQSGISTLTGAFALWYAMFFSNKTILIVSKRDLESVGFLDKNIKFVYNNLPQEFKDVWGNPPLVFNEHTIKFPNGSTIQSLTSSPDTLRSYSSSLNIIDECAFMPHMEEMWAAGWPTLQHGGNIIAISTPCGAGGWYYNTWEDAIAHNNQFNPIEINWWDMDWVIEYQDELTGKNIKLCPKENIRECISKEERDKWGKYYSPWLEEQYRQLQQRGEGHLFRQEILAEFIGTGNTVLPASALQTIKDTVNNNFRTVEKVKYIHPVSGEDFVLDFEKQLWIWKTPVRPTPPTIENGRIIKLGSSGHLYGIGVDISSGEDTDFSAIQVVDYTAMEQVAELNIKTLPNILVMMVDYIARWYNMAYVIPERTGMGIPVCQAIYNDVAYSNIYRMKNRSGSGNRKIGYPTSPTYKPALVKCLLDHLSTDDCIQLYSSRLFSQLSIFVHLNNRKVGNIKGPGNHDDLVMSLALALIGVLESVQSDHRNLAPAHTPTDEIEQFLPKVDINHTAVNGGINCLLPMMLGTDIITEESPAEQIAKFQRQLGGVIITKPKK